MIKHLGPLKILINLLVSSCSNAPVYWSLFKERYNSLKKILLDVIIEFRILVFFWWFAIYMYIYFICVYTHTYIYTFTHIRRLKLNKIYRLDSAVTLSITLFQEFILYRRKDMYTLLHYIFYFIFFIVSDMNDVKSCWKA